MENLYLDFETLLQAVENGCYTLWSCELELPFYLDFEVIEPQDATLERALYA